MIPKQQINQTIALIAHAKALQQADQLEQAKKIYLKILKADPNNIDVLHLLGILFHQMQDYPTAIQYFHKVMKLNPRIPQLYHNLGLAYKEKGDLKNAMDCYQKAIALKPDYAAAYEKMGNALVSIGNYQIAIDHYQKSLQLNSNNADAWNNCGTAFRQWDMIKDAEECYRNALKLQPNFKGALANLAQVLRDQGKFEEPLQYLESLNKHYPDDIDSKISLFSFYDHMCNWQSFQERQQILHQTGLKESKTTPTLASWAALSYDWEPRDLLTLAKKHAKPYEQQAQKLKASVNFKFAREKKQRLKIGYLSSDFHNHPVAYLTNNLYATHDREQFEVYGFSLGGSKNTSSYRQHIAKSCDHFIDLFLSQDKESAEQIYQHGIDILVDLNGYTQGSRMTILALRPAPIQAHYLGFLGTTGANFFDYILADEIVIPPEVANTAYSEKPVYLPYYQITDNQQIISDKPLTRKDYGLPENAFVYCCFNNAYKIQPKIFSIWMDILSKTPNAVLWLFSNSTLTENNLRREAQQRGVNPDRLIFTKYEDRPIYLARYRLADLFLDTLFYNANTTGTDALWAGLPLITHPTKNFAGRGAASSLTALGLSELVMPDLDTYRNTAIHFYEHPETLQKIREKLQKNIHTQPLFDTKRFVKHLEKAYWQMWEIFQKGETPRAIKIN